MCEIDKNEVEKEKEIKDENSEKCIVEASGSKKEIEDQHVDFEGVKDQKIEAKSDVDEVSKIEVSNATYNVDAILSGVELRSDAILSDVQQWSDAILSGVEQRSDAILSDVQQRSDAIPYSVQFLASDAILSVDAIPSMQFPASDAILSVDAILSSVQLSDAILSSVQWSDAILSVQRSDAILSVPGARISMNYAPRVCVIPELFCPVKRRDLNKWECWKYRFPMCLSKSRRSPNIWNRKYIQINDSQLRSSVWFP